MRDARQFPEAIESYRAHVVAEPLDFDIWVQLGHLLKEEGRFDDATAAYGQARMLKDDDADLHLNLGHFAKLRGDTDAARTHYRRSHRLDGNDFAAAELDALDAPPPPEPPPLPRPPAGGIDMVVGTLVRGWAHDPEGDGPAVVTFTTVEGEPVGLAVARLPRTEEPPGDSAGAADRFEAHLSLPGQPSRPARVVARLQRTGEELPGSPFEVAPFATVSPSAPPVTGARLAVAKPVVVAAGRETALIVTHAPDGVVKPHVLPLLQALRQGGVDVVLVIAADRPVLVSDTIGDVTAGILVRDNRGYDFAAWAHALRLYPELYDASILYLVNDSLFGPNRPEALADILARIRADGADGADLIGLTATHEFAWHLQTYFLAVKHRLLSSIAFAGFIDGIRILPGKTEVVDTYEIPLTGRMIEAGFAAKALFASDEPRNPTMHGWRQLLAGGFPFVKTLLFREAFAAIDMTGWRDVLGAHGFAIPLLESTLRHTGVTGPVAPDFPLLVRSGGAPVQPARGHRDTVAFYGAWNEAGRSGVRSRAIVAALRRLDVRLNLHPLKEALAVSRPVAPALDIVDVDQPADVAIVDLEADAWAWLAPGQRAAIERAAHRIGVFSHGPVMPEAGGIAIDRAWVPDGSHPAGEGSAGGPPVEAMPLDGETDDLASAIRASLDRLEGTGTPMPALPPPLPRLVRGGVPLALAPLPPGVVVAPLAAGGFRYPPQEELARVANTRDAWIVFVQADALLSPRFAAEVEVVIRARHDVSVFYADDLASGEDGLLGQLRLKPAFDVTLFAAQDAVGTPLIVRGSALHQLGGLRHQLGEAVLDDLVLRALALRLTIERIPKVLLAIEGPRPRVPAPARRAVLAASPVFAGYTLEPGRTAGTSRLARRFPERLPGVSLLLAAPGDPDEAGLLLDALARTDWPHDRLHVLVATGQDGFAGLPARAPSLPVHRVELPPAGNGSAVLNALWRAAETDLVVFIKQGAIPADEDWLKALMTFAMDDTVGAVAPQIVDSHGRIRDAGVAGGLLGGCAPAWFDRPSTGPSYQDWLQVHRQWSMLTGRVLATRRALVETVGGFDPALEEENGPDLCLKLRASGYRIVSTPHATFIADDRRAPFTRSGRSLALFRQRWRAWLDDDPACHPGFRRDTAVLEPRVDTGDWFA